MTGERTSFHRTERVHPKHHGMRCSISTGKIVVFHVAMANGSCAAIVHPIISVNLHPTPGTGISREETGALHRPWRSPLGRRALMDGYGATPVGPRHSRTRRRSNGTEKPSGLTTQAGKHETKQPVPCRGISDNVDKVTKDLTSAQEVHHKCRGATAEESGDSLAVSVESAWRSFPDNTKRVS